MGFYQTICRQYGAHTVSLMKQWARTNMKLASFKNRRIFLLTCRQLGLTPQHIQANTNNIGEMILVEDGGTGQGIKNFRLRLVGKIINFEISTTIKTINCLERSLIQLSQNLSELLPNHIVNNFRDRQMITYNNKFNLIKRANCNKISNLKLKMRNECIKTKESWIKNLTNVEIPGEISNFLALGFKFALSPSNKEIDVTKTLANIENMLYMCPEAQKNIYRAKITNILTNYYTTPTNTDYLNQIYKKARKFLKEHSELVVTRADKGNVTVIMTREQYEEKSHEIVSDNKYYIQLDNDPTSTYQQKANKLISTFKNSNIITEQLSKTLTIYNQAAPKFYGLPKIHKPTLTLRPIISSINAPNSKIANLVTDILTQAYVRGNDYYINDSFEFAEFIQNKQLPAGYVLVSLDVVSLFSNIPKTLIIKSINKHWQTIKTHTTFNKKQFLELIEFILDTTYFKYNNVFYKQILGTPMGATVSPIISQYVMDDLLEAVVPKLNFQPPFLKKYVDDLILSIPTDEKDSVLRVFNKYNKHIQFTIEEETNNSVPFLDTKLIRNNDNQVVLDWYVKPTFSGRYINYKSFHTEKTKINLVLGLKNRIEKICHPDFRENNLRKLFNILIDNSYPERLLKKLIFNSRTYNLNRTNRLMPGTPEISAFLTRNQPTYYYSIPAIETVSNKIIQIFKDIPTIKLALTYNKKIGNLFTQLKDKDETMKKAGVIYSIPCSDCDKWYIGQTSRVLKDRISSHGSDCRLGKRTCALAEHNIDTGHIPHFSEVKILHSERNTRKRLFLEMTEIIKHPNSLNKKKDTQDLSVIYSNLINLQLKTNNDLNTS